MGYLANRLLDPNDLGYFATPEALIAAYPVGIPGVFAIVGSTDSIWVWDTTTEAWVDSGSGGSNLWSEGIGTIYPTNLAKKIGIGINSPITPLHVAGDWASGVIQQSQLTVSDLNNTNKRLSIGLNTSGIGVLQAYTNGVSYNSLLLNPEGGNVGIGTTSPSAQLHVSNEGNTAFKVERAGVDPAVLNFQVTNGRVTLGYEAGYGMLFQDGVNSVVSGIVRYLDGSKWLMGDSNLTDLAGSTLSVKNNTSIGANYWNVAAPSNGAIIEGKVGIGTTNPSSKFEVKNTNTIGIEPNGIEYQELLSGVNILTDNNLFFSSSNGTVDKKIGITYYQGGFGYRSALEVANTASGYGNLLLMKSGGNVGIGTTDPSQTLHVVGSGKFTGSIIVNSYIQNSTSNVIDMDYGGSNNSIQILKNTLFTGNVGIGTTDPSSKLHVVYAPGASSVPGIILEGTNDFPLLKLYRNQTLGAGSLGNIDFVYNPSGGSANTNGVRIDAVTDGTALTTALAFHTHNGTSLNEVAKLNSYGRLILGTPVEQAVGTKLQISKDTIASDLGSYAAGFTRLSDSTGVYIGYAAASNVGLIDAFRYGATNNNLSIGYNSLNVGIGTISQKNKLSIKSDSSYVEIGTIATGYGAIGFVDALLDTTNYALTGDGTGNTYLNYSTGKTLGIRKNNASIASFSSDGYFGIGVAPDFPLTVYGASGVQMRITDGTKSLYFGGSWIGGIPSFGTNTTESMSIVTNNTSRIYIDSTGQVGVGTISPQNKFVVSNGGAVGLEVDPVASPDYVMMFAYNRSTSAYKNIIFSTSKVGIGSANPTYELDVTGTIRATDYVYQDGTFAEIYVADGSTAQSIATGTTYTKLTAFTTNGSSSNCTADATNDKITITKAGKYLVNCVVSGSDGATGAEFKMALFYDGTEQNNIHSTNKFNAGSEIDTMSMSGILVSAANKDIDVRLRHSEVSDVNFTTQYANLTITYIGE